MEAARPLGLEVYVLQAATEREIVDAFDRMMKLRAKALVVGADEYFASRSQQLAALSKSKCRRHLYSMTSRPEEYPTGRMVRARTSCWPQ